MAHTEHARDLQVIIHMSRLPRDNREFIVHQEFLTGQETIMMQLILWLYTIYDVGLARLLRTWNALDSVLSKNSIKLGLWGGEGATHYSQYIKVCI